ncbi:MAG: acyl-protein synthetase [Opitutus sp.]|nr:acyl-protein synthetase [Opitutus sp.]
MPSSFAELSEAVLALPTETKADLADKLIASLAADVPAEIHEAQMTEVMRRRAEVLSGKVQLISGDVVERSIQRLLNEITRVPR